MTASLTQKQQRFVEEYLVDLNATAAAKRAGYSAKTAEWQGPQLLGKTHVADAIKAARASLSERTKRTVDDVMADIRRRGQLAEDVGEFGAALKASELEGKHLGAFEKDNTQRNPLGNFDPKQFFSDLFRKTVE